MTKRPRRGTRYNSGVPRPQKTVTVTGPQPAISEEKREEVIGTLVLSGAYDRAGAEAAFDATFPTTKQPLPKVWARTMHRAGAAEFVSRPEQQLRMRHTHDG